MPSSIHQEIQIQASPERVYSALTDAGQFQAFTGAPAEIVNWDPLRKYLGAK